MKNIFILWMFIFSFILQAKEPLPVMNSAVVDTINLLKPEERNDLETQLRSIHDSGKMQMAIMIIDKLPSDESVEEYSIRVADEWKLGSAKEDNGLLFLIAVGSGRMRIEVGQGLEGVITDLYSKRIMDQITPALKNKEYYNAMKTTVNRIVEEIDADAIRKIPPTPEEIQAEEERVAKEAAERKAKNEELMQIAGYIFSALVFVVGVYFLMAYKSIPKEVKELEIKIALTSRSIELANDQHSQTSREVSSMQTDADKLRMYRLIEEISSERSNLGSSKSNIAKYKQYLGEL